MLGEATMGLSALQAAFNLAKGMKNLDTTVAINSAVIELQENILAAQSAQTALIQRIAQLEQKVAEFEKWDAEKEKYELKEIHPQNFAYVIKADARGAQPTHLICATCYENRKKSIMQKSSAVHMTCPVCQTQIQFKESGLSGATWGRGSWSP